MGRQQLKEKQALAILDGSEKGEGRDEERAALGGGESEESGHPVPERQESNVSLKGEDELPVSTPVAFTDAIPMLNMDSDTDVEGEEKGEECTVPVTSNIAQKADPPSNTAQLHMDSDTDVDEDHDTVDKVLESVPSSENHKHFQAVSLIRPEDITMDSDTDDDDDDALLGAAPKAGPVSFQSTHTPACAPSVQTEDFHLDSDTDVDEEEEKECAALHTCSKLDETPSGLDISPGGPGSVPAAPPILHTDSETDDEATPAPAVSEPSVGFAVTEPGSTADTPADLDILSDSDTNMKDDSPLVVPFVVTALSFLPSTASGVVQSDSDTDVDESGVPPAGDRVNKAEPREDSETDVEEEVDFQATGEDQHLSLHRENTPGYLAPSLQNFSTPVQLSGNTSLNKNFIEHI